MAEVHETAASLRFSGDDLDPNEISATVGALPHRSVRKGSMMMLPSGREIVARTGLWRLKVENVTPGDLDRQITEIFAGLTRDFTLWQQLASRYGGNIFTGVFLGGFNEGLCLLPETLGAIAQRGLTLEFDIYSGKDTRENDEQPEAQ